MTISVTNEITVNRISDVLCGAFDTVYGFSYFWAQYDSKVIPPNPDPEFVKSDGYDGKLYAYQCALFEGGAFVVKDDEGTKHALTIGKIRKGLQIMSEKYPRHFADLVNEDDDANTSDVLVQCALFGEERYA